MKFKIKIYHDSKIVEGEMKVNTQWHSKKVIREIMKCGRLDYTEEIKEKMKRTPSDGFCMILGERCYKECPHHYHREVNKCWKGDEKNEQPD